MDYGDGTSRNSGSGSGGVMVAVALVCVLVSAIVGYVIFNETQPKKINLSDSPTEKGSASTETPGTTTTGAASGASGATGASASSSSITTLRAYPRGFDSRAWYIDSKSNASKAGGVHLGPDPASLDFRTKDCVKGFGIYNRSNGKYLMPDSKMPIGEHAFGTKWEKDVTFPNACWAKATGGCRNGMATYQTADTPNNKKGNYRLSFTPGSGVNPQVVVAKKGANSVYDANPNNFCWAPANGGSVYL